VPDDALFEVRPAEFIAARTALVRRLREAGRDEAARAAARRRKPSVALWAANQALRADRGAVDRLRESVDRLRTAQTRNPADLRAALARQREALDDLLATARTSLGSIPVRVTPDLLGRISATLLGAAVDPASRRDFERGRLAEERTAPGFDAFEAGRSPRSSRRHEDAAPLPAPTPGRRAGRERRPKAATRDRKVIALDAARRAREARAALEAERAVRREEAAALRAEAGRRHEAAAAVAREVETLRADLTTLRLRHTEARRAANAAERAARRASAREQRLDRAPARRRVAKGARSG
jgi:hypothetical protein